MATVFENQVQELYIAYFGRAADPAGLAFYAGSLSVNGTTIEAIATSFANSSEAQKIVSLSTTDFLTAMYQQAFARVYDPAPEKDGLFWANAIESGTTSKSLAMVQILQGAPVSSQDASAVVNKVNVASEFTRQVEAGVKDYSGAEVAASAKAILNGVTPEESTVTNALAQVPAAVGTMLSLISNNDTLLKLSSEGTVQLDLNPGTSGNDVLIDEGEHSPVLMGFEGNDTLEGPGILFGGSGDDQYTIGSEGVSIIIDSSGNDTLIVPSLLTTIESFEVSTMEAFTFNNGKDAVLYDNGGDNSYVVVIANWQSENNRLEKIVGTGQTSMQSFTHAEFVDSVNFLGDFSDSVAESMIGIPSGSADSHVALFEYISNLDSSSYANAMGGIDTTGSIGSEVLMDYLL